MLWLASQSPAQDTVNEAASFDPTKITAFKLHPCAKGQEAQLVKTRSDLLDLLSRPGPGLLIRAPLFTEKALRYVLARHRAAKSSYAREGPGHRENDRSNSWLISFDDWMGKVRQPLIQRSLHQTSRGNLMPEICEAIYADTFRSHVRIALSSLRSMDPATATCPSSGFSGQRSFWAKRASGPSIWFSGYGLQM